jgi:exocyst complex component 1
MSEDYSTTREHIIASLFSKVNADGVLEDTYVTHVKIWEDVPAGTTQLSEVNGMKPRYIMVAGKVLTFIGA